MSELVGGSSTDPSVQSVVIECLNCGLPLVQNHHPDAGKPEHINRVGCPKGCLPCAEKRANGRAAVIRLLREWAETEIEKAEPIRKQALQDMVNQIEWLEEARKLGFRMSR